jgi:hypothetical protein
MIEVDARLYILFFTALRLQGVDHIDQRLGMHHKRNALAKSHNIHRLYLPCSCDKHYLPGIEPDCIIASRSEPFRYLSTHRMTQPSSLEIKDFVVKSLTQSSKHRCTSLEYICYKSQLACLEREVLLRGTWVLQYRHEFLHLFLLHS